MDSLYGAMTRQRIIDGTFHGQMILLYDTEAFRTWLLKRLHC